MGKIVNSVIQDMWEVWQQFYDENFLNPDPLARLDEQLRTIYGRGEINKDRFLQLRSQLHQGRISKTDLYVIHQAAIRRMEAQGNYIPHKSNPELERSLDRLYADRVWVEETRDQMKEYIQALYNDTNWIKEQAESARQDAGKAMPDETTARSYLQVWQKLLSLSQSIENELQAMERDLMNLDLLEKEINAAITRIKLLRSREQLAELNQRVHSDILSPG